jgi:hypothetical protein
VRWQWPVSLGVSLRPLRLGVSPAVSQLYLSG